MSSQRSLNSYLCGFFVAYFPDEISVEGKLKVEEQKDDGYIVSVFQMEAGSVKPAAK